MKTLTIDVASREQVNTRFEEAMTGKVTGERLSFPTLELFYKLMNPRRLQLIKAIQSWGPVGIRELARRLERDPGNLVRDLKPLKEWGIVEDTGQGLMIPYDEIRLELVIGKVA